jgi:sugar lactone lactonase YvrE
LRHEASLILLSLVVFGTVIGAGMLRVHAQGGNTPEAQARTAAQLALEGKTPKLNITEDVLPLMIPNHTIGETEGVTKNAKGHLFVYSRTGMDGSARGGTAAELFEFDENNKFVKMWAPDNYAASFAHAVRIDKYENVWMVDEGSGMVVKMDPNGLVKMVLGRKPEAIDYLEKYLERGEKDDKPEQRHPVGQPYTFNRPTDVAWDPQDNIYISDGYGNSRVAKFTKDGTWVKAVGTFGNGNLQFNTVHGIDVGPDGNVYVADRGNFRIQVYDYDLNFKKFITGVGAPWTVRVTPKYIYSGDGTGKIYRLDHDGKLVAWAQTGLGQGQNGCIIHSIHVQSDDTIYRGSCSEWNIEKITVKASS